MKLGDKIEIIESWYNVNKGEIYTIRKLTSDSGNPVYINIHKIKDGNYNGGYNIPKSIFKLVEQENYEIY